MKKSTIIIVSLILVGILIISVGISALMTVSEMLSTPESPEFPSTSETRPEPTREPRNLRELIMVRLPGEFVVLFDYLLSIIVICFYSLLLFLLIVVFALLWILQTILKKRSEREPIPERTE